MQYNRPGGQEQDMPQETQEQYQQRMGGDFGALALLVSRSNWPSADADGVATAALERIQEGVGDIDEMAWLLWYVAVYAQSKKVPLQSVADRLTALLARTPPALPGMAR